MDHSTQENFKIKAKQHKHLTLLSNLPTPITLVGDFNAKTSMKTYFGLRYGLNEHELVVFEL